MYEILNFNSKKANSVVKIRKEGRKERKKGKKERKRKRKGNPKGHLDSSCQHHFEILSELYQDSQNDCNSCEFPEVAKQILGKRLFESPFKITYSTGAACKVRTSQLLLALFKIHVLELSSLWVSLTLSFPHFVKCIEYLKVLFKYPPLPKREGSSLCTGYRIKTFQITSCQHKFFCLSPRNFSAVKAFWSKFPLKPVKLHVTSSPKLAFYKSHCTSQPSLYVLSIIQDKQSRTQIILFGAAGGFLKYTVYPLIVQ